MMDMKMWIANRVSNFCFTVVIIKGKESVERNNVAVAAASAAAVAAAASAAAVAAAAYAVSAADDDDGDGDDDNDDDILHTPSLCGVFLIICNLLDW